MNHFPFNQKDKTRDCGYRCLYYVIDPNASYESWLDQFRFFDPIKTGIFFNDICTVLDYYKIDYHFTNLDKHGVYIVYSGIWLHPEGKRHGHYFIYDNGYVLCSTHQKPYRMDIADIIKRLEAKNVDHAFRCLRIEK